MKPRVALIAPFPPPYAGMTVLSVTTKLSLEENGIIVNLINTNVVVSKSISKLKLKTVYQTVCFYSQMWKLFKSDIAIIISSSGLSFYFRVIPSLFICKLLRKGVILDFVGGGMLTKLSPLNVFCLKMFKNIIVPTSVFGRAFKSKGIESSVFPHIVNVERFAHLKERSNKNILLSAKALEKYSSIDHLIKAYSIVKKKISNVELIIAGDGPEREHLEKMVQTLDLRDVKFIGNVNYDQMPSLYQNATLFIHGTQIESFGIALVEAMASGTPVVSTNVGGIPDVVKDNITGFLVEYGDYVTMANKIITLLEDKELYDKFSKNSVERAANYSPKALSYQLISLINSVHNA